MEALLAHEGALLLALLGMEFCLCDLDDLAAAAGWVLRCCIGAEAALAAELFVFRILFCTLYTVGVVPWVTRPWIVWTDGVS